MHRLLILTACLLLPVLSLRAEEKTSKHRLIGLSATERARTHFPRVNWNADVLRSEFAAVPELMCLESAAPAARPEASALDVDVPLTT